MMFGAKEITSVESSPQLGALGVWEFCFARPP